MAIKYTKYTYTESPTQTRITYGDGLHPKINGHISAINWRHVNHDKYDSTESKISVEVADECSRKNTAELLKRAGFTADTIREYTSPHAVSLTLEPSMESRSALIPVIVALTKTYSLGGGQTIFPMLKEEEAAEIILREIKETGIRPSQAKMLSVHVEDHPNPKEYGYNFTPKRVSAEIQLPGSFITKMEEETLASGKISAVKPVYQTQFTLTHDVEGKKLESALKEAGIKTEFVAYEADTPSDHRTKQPARFGWPTQVVAEGRIEEMLPLLKGIHYLPQALADELQEAAKGAHAETEKPANHFRSMASKRPKKTEAAASR